MEKIGIEIKYTFPSDELKDLCTFLWERSFRIRTTGGAEAGYIYDGEDEAGPDGLYTRDPDHLYRRPNPCSDLLSIEDFWLRVKGGTRLEKAVQDYEAEKNQEDRK